MPQKRAVVLCNLGTPDEPTTPALKRYLREFLLDWRVIDIAAPLRHFLVRAIIVPRRASKSAELYRKVWSDDGSPLLLESRRLAEELSQLFDRKGEAASVHFAMRYGNPSLAALLEQLHAEGVDEIDFVPLYPQYASATTGSTIEAIARYFAERQAIPALRITAPFYDHPAYIEALAQTIAPQLKEAEPKIDHLLFTYHGLPLRQLEKAHPEPASRCRRQADCCEVIDASNRFCYRAHCLSTTRLTAQKLGLAEGSYSSSFQSRLGRAEWTGPATDARLRALRGEGVRHLAVVAPSFVADCLETLEEIAGEGRHTFLDAGGESFRYISCLNHQQHWVEALFQIIKR